jgi:hypothetical protein
MIALFLAMCPVVLDDEVNEEDRKRRSLHLRS